MTPERLWLGGFCLVVAVAALRRLGASAESSLRGRLTDAVKEGAVASLFFYMAWKIVGALVTLSISLTAETVGYERRKDHDARQHGQLATLVELDETLMEPPIRNDAEAREEQEERKAKAAKERARTWKRFVKKNRVRILPAWITLAEQYLLAGAPLALFVWAWCSGTTPRTRT